MRVLFSFNHTVQLTWALVSSAELEWKDDIVFIAHFTHKAFRLT